MRSSAPPREAVPSPAVRPPAPAPPRQQEEIQIENVIRRGGASAPIVAAAVANGRWKDTRTLRSRDYFFIDMPDVDNMWTM